MTDFIENFYTDRNQFDYEDPDTQKNRKSGDWQCAALNFKK